MKALIRVIPWLCLAAAGLLIAPVLASACPGCKEALFDPDQLSQKLASAKGYALSIGMLLTVPFLIIAGFTAFIIASARRMKQADRSSVDTPGLSR